MRKRSIIPRNYPRQPQAEVADDIGMQLHDWLCQAPKDRSTLGEALSEEERGLLEAWYEQKDSVEAAVLKQRVVTLPSLQMLQMQLEVALPQLASSIERLREIKAENERLRIEILGLKQRLAMPRSA